MENLHYQGQDLSVKTVGSAQNQNSLLHFCSCDLALVFNPEWSFLCFSLGFLGGVLDLGSDFHKSAWNSLAGKWVGSSGKGQPDRGSPVVMGTVESPPSIHGLCTAQGDLDQTDHKGRVYRSLSSRDQRAHLHPWCVFVSLLLPALGRDEFLLFC